MTIETTANALTSQPRAAGTAAGQGATNGAAAVSSDFETFLKMLTVQMQNQDPLNPIESSDFAVQLATFAGVEQQTRTNQLLSQMGDRLGLAGLAQAADWVGREALVEAPVPLGEGPIDLVVPAAPSGTDAMDLVVMDRNGRPVGQIALDPSDRTLRWDGSTDAGALPRGALYSFRVESYSQGQVIDTQAVAAYAKVNEARIGEDGAARIVMDGGAEVAVANVTALRSGADPAGG